MVTSGYILHLWRMSELPFVETLKLIDSLFYMELQGVHRLGKSGKAGEKWQAVQKTVFL